MAAPASWLPFEPATFIPIADAIWNSNPDEIALNPPPHTWAPARVTALRVGLGRDDSARSTRVAELIIGMATAALSENLAGFTMANLIERGWLVLHADALGRVAAVEDGVVQLQAQVEALSVQMGGMTGQIGGMTGQMGDLTGQMAGITGQVDGLGVRLGGIEGQLAALLARPV